MHVVAERGHLDVVKYLVGQGADINIKDDYGVCDNDGVHVKLYTGLNCLVPRPSSKEEKMVW